MKDALTIVLRGEDVPLADFTRAINGLQKLVEALATDVASGAELEWVVDDLQTSSAIATIRGLPRRPADAWSVERVVHAYEEVGRAAARRLPIPYSPAVRAAVSDIIGVINGRVTSVGFETEDEGAEVFSGPPGIDAATSTQAPVIPVPVSGASLGAVRGRIETVSRHKGLRFTLYESSSGRAVSCYLTPGPAAEELMRDMWGKLAIVEGRVQRDPVEGHALSVRQVTHVEILPEMTPGEWRAARGAAPAQRRGLSPEEAVRRGRDG
jgi:hypothetical protein